MLSRVADSLYWTSRYLERAEHTARLLDVNLNQMLDTATPVAGRWDRVRQSLHAPLPAGIGADDAYRIAEYLTFDSAVSASILSCISAARDNAHQVRERISSEMWEQLNRLYLRVRQISANRFLGLEPTEFFKEVKEGSHLFQGITDSTMNHDEGWQFIQVGRYLERADATTTLLDTYFRDFQRPNSIVDDLEWVALLKSCTSFEAYCKVYTANVLPERVAEFLLLNAGSPRSIRFSADRVHDAIQAISGAAGMRAVGRAQRLAGRLRAELDYGQVDEIMSDMHSYLEGIQRLCVQVHTAVHQAFIAYSADSVLTA
jgi:uncharacterized alpha-E superfamily protein